MPVRWAVTWWARLRGLLGRAPDETLLVIAPCRAIHTFGMKAAIDVAFIDGDGVVAAVERGLPPRRYRRSESAVAVIERFASSAPFFSPRARIAIDPAAQTIETLERSER